MIALKVRFRGVCWIQLQCWEVKGEARKWLSSSKKRVLWEAGSVMDVCCKVVKGFGWRSEGR